MVRELTIQQINVRLWDSLDPAPIFAHPHRLLRTHPHRQAEFDMIAALIPIPWSWDDIVKDHVGKPFLKNNTAHIGISHSNGIGCFAWSSINFGIDIQTPHPSIFKVRQKYCHPEELSFLTNTEADTRYLMIWSAKEAIYKYHGHGIDFSHDLIAQPFDRTADKILVECKSPAHKCTTFIVYFKHHSNHLLTVAHENNS